MFEVRRNHIIVTVLVLMIAVAAYLSFSETPSRITPEVANIENAEQITIAELPLDTNFFDEAIETLPPDVDVAMTADQATEVVAMEEDLHNIDKVEAVEVVISKKNEAAENMSSEEASIEAASLKTVDVSYFLEEKMLREQSRASQIEQLTEYVANQNLDQETKAKAAESLLAIQERIEKESSAESLLRAKGFKDVFVRMDNESVDVVVNKTELTDEEVAQIEEIVHRKTGYSVTQIKITPLNLSTGVTKSE